MTESTPPPVPPSSLDPAGLLRRFAALFYDGLLLIAILFVFTFVVVALRSGRAIAPNTPWYETSLFVLAMLFFCGFWTHGGQTAGMRAWRIRLVTLDGGPVTWRRAIVRLCGAVLAVLPLGLGFWASLRDSRRRCWHDRWSGTLVVRVPRVSAPGPTR